MNAYEFTYLEKNEIINDDESAYWQLDAKKRLSHWSTGFLNLLEYKIDDITIGLDYFIQNLVHENDRRLFKDNFYGLIENFIPFTQIIRILDKHGDFHEFKVKTCSKTLIDNIRKINFNKVMVKTPEKIKDDPFYYIESAKMTSTGSWYVDFIEQKSYWDYVAKNILEYPEDYVPSLKNSHKYYHKDHINIATKAFQKCGMQGIPFSLEIKMITSTNKTLWVNAMGKPVYDDNRQIVAIRGVFQDINDIKNKEIKLKKTSDIISSQNSRLFNFAHIVSHNLRSHSSNLELIVQLVKSFEDPNEKLEMIDQISDISSSLSTTIIHLNEIVTIQNKVNQEKVSIDFEKTLNQVTQSINQIIAQQNATILSDFSEIKHIDYIPAYLDSILLNLLTNAIKYRHPDRDPIIKFKTYKDQDSSILEINDNGLGIDMEKFGDKLFGMYKTFHYNKDAVGIGLFITKSQIESLGGEIFVESEIDKGTTFKIKF